MSEYHVGNGSQQIRLAVDIDTVGLAASRAIVLDISKSDPSISVAHSDNATGDISRTQIGIAKDLSGMRLSILTKIDLLGSQSEREAESKRIDGKYILDDGNDGHIVFDHPEKTISPDFSSVILFKVIDLI